MKIKFKWEEINNSSEMSGVEHWECAYRAIVIGGWLVRYECAYDYIHYGSDDPNHDIWDGWNKRFYTMTFISDPNHEWEIDES